jgi:hypothetical protein
VERQTDALLDHPIMLCGEPVRQMWAEDMLTLDALENPFISGSSDGVALIDCAAFIWQLAEENDHTASLWNLWRRGRFIRRIARLDLEETCKAIVAYVDRMLMEEKDPKLPAPEEKKPDTFAKPPRTHFLVPLLVNLAGDIGHQDPMSGRLLAHTPLPRLIQYSRAIDEKKGGPKSYGEIDSLRNQCMDKVNQLIAAARSAS